ncbi:MAG: class B sortase [Acutalibacteraceae bacterium]|nr:class B sortase [Acutalibacteraceae bacterium]
MNKKVAVILTAVFAAVAVLFTVLAAVNFTKKSDSGIIDEKTAGLVLADGVEADALSAELDGVKSNAMKAQTQYPEGILEELKQAYAINNDLAGWLSIPGTEMDTAVLLGEDNSYYLKKDFYNKTTYETSADNYGNIYLDYRCLPDRISKNMVIHGHTTGKSDGIPKQAFRSLYDYRDKNHFIKNPIIRYKTLTGEYTYKICAVFLSNTQPKDDNGYFFNYIYPDMGENNMVGYIEQVNQRKLYETGVTLEPTDKVITLSTCIYDYGKNVDTRLVVVGRLLHEGESEAIDASLVKDNPDYRRPQVWYNAKGKTNPYKGTEKWQPSPN